MAWIRAFMNFPGNIINISFAEQKGIIANLDAFKAKQAGGACLAVGGRVAVWNGRRSGHDENLDGFDDSYAPSGSTLLVHGSNHSAPFFEIVLETPALAIGSFAGTGKEGTENTLAHPRVRYERPGDIQL